MLRGGGADDFFKFSGGELRYRYWDGSTNTRVKTPVNVGETYTAVARVDSTNMDLWVDGVHEDSNNGPSNPATKSSTRGLAYDNAQNDDYYNGQIYWFKIFDESISDGRASSLSICGYLNCNPLINSVSTTPKIWKANSSVEVSVEADDTDGTVSNVEFTAYRPNGSSISETVSTETNGNYTVSNLFKPVSNGKYTIGINVTDDQGAWNYTNRTYEFKDLSLPKTSQWSIKAQQSDGQVAYADQNFTVTIIEDNADDTPPKWFDFKDNSTGSIIQTEVLNISSEWRDNETGLGKAVLSTNESGSFENVSTAPCRQEFANATDDDTQQTSSDQDPPTDGNCGIEPSGGYKESKGWIDGGYEETVDGNWSTSAQSDEDNGYSNVTLNYTKPSTALSATWEVKDSDGRENVSIPDSCFNYYENKLRLMFESRYQTFSGLTGYDIQYHCYNGGWNKIEDQSSGGLNGAQIYEEAIHWNTLENVSDGKNLTDFRWHKTSFNGTLGYKIYGRDAAGNWNQTEVNQVRVYNALSESISDTAEISGSISTSGSYFGNSSADVSLGDSISSLASTKSFLEDTLGITASSTDNVTVLERLNTPVTISLDLATIAYAEDNQSTSIDVEDSKQGQVTGTDKASATLNLSSDVEVLGISATEFVQSTIGLNTETASRTRVTSSLSTGISLLDNVTDKVSEGTSLSSEFNIGETIQNRVNASGFSSAKITVNEDFTTSVFKIGEIFTPIDITTGTENQANASGQASATIGLSTAIDSQGLVTEAIHTAVTIEEICWAGSPCYQNIVDSNQTDTGGSSGGETGVIGDDEPITIIKPVPVTRALPESIQLYYQKHRNPIQGFLLFLSAVSVFWLFKKLSRLIF